MFASLKVGHLKIEFDNPFGQCDYLVIMRIY